MTMLLALVFAEQLVQLETTLTTYATLVVCRIGVVGAEGRVLEHIALIFELPIAGWGEGASNGHLRSMLDSEVPLFGGKCGEGGFTLVTSQPTSLLVS